MRPGEDPRAAAIRETKEETGVALSAAQLSGPIIVKCRHEFRKELNYIFEVRREGTFELSVDNREIVDAAYFTTCEAATHVVTPTVRIYLEETTRRKAQAATP
jgi:8-oxo-dGTP pyrophosphatase MutT (NUDIX family)